MFEMVEKENIQQQIIDHLDSAENKPKLLFVDCNCSSRDYNSWKYPVIIEYKCDLKYVIVAVIFKKGLHFTIQLKLIKLFSL